MYEKSVLSERFVSERDSRLTSIFLMCLLGALFYCYEYYLRVVPPAISAELKATYHISDAGLGFLSACFYYSYLMMQLPVGIMMDKYGPRKILTMACFSCAVGTYMFCGTDNFSISQVGRFLIGFGSAFAYVGFLKISNLWLPKKYYAMMAGVCTALGMAGAMTGEVLMISLVDSLGWREALYYAGFVGLLLTALLWLFIKDKQQIAESNITKIPSAHNFKEELFKVLKSSQIWLAGIVGCCTFITISAFAEMWALPFLHHGLGYDKHLASAGSSLIFLGFGVGGPIWGYLSEKMRSRKLPLILGSLIAALFVYLLITKSAQYSQTQVMLLLFAVGLFSGAEILVFAIGNDISHSSISATAASFINMLVMVGGALLQPLIGIFLDRLQVAEIVTQTEHTFADYSAALMVLPLSLLLAAGLSIFVSDNNNGD